MNIKECTADDCERIDYILNHATVKPGFFSHKDYVVNSKESINFDEMYVIMPTQDILFLGTPNGSELTFEVHGAVLPCARGKLAVVAAKRCIRYMFTETKCVRLEARCRKGRKDTLMFDYACGFKFDAQLSNGDILLSINREDFTNG